MLKSTSDWTTAPDVLLVVLVPRVVEGEVAGHEGVKHPPSLLAKGAELPGQQHH
jgi:hypothetical protein